jgi:hypothetical protein
MSGEFCPNCGTGRIGALRFCRSCGFDYDSLAGAAPSVAGLSAPAEQTPPVVQPVQPVHPVQSAQPVPPVQTVQSGPVRGRPSPRALFGAGLAILVVAVVAASTLNRPEPASPVAGGATPTPTPKATPRATATPTATLPEVLPTEAPTEPTTGTYLPGQTVTVTSDGDPYLEILVDKVGAVAKYDGQYSDDTPEIKGDVFIHARVTYKSLQNGASYNSFDWSVFVDDRAVDDFTFVSYGPEPRLGSGELPEGRTAQGWVVYEVPKTGRVVMSYGSGMFTNDAPVFEFVLRSK